MNSVDLSALRMAEQPPVIPKRPIGPRLLAAGALGMVVAVAATFLWPLLQPARIVPAVQVESVAAIGPSTVAMAEAAGWIEPDPFPVLVRPLVSGRVERIPLLEGAEVQEGITIVATLASAALQAQKERADVAVVERERELVAAQERLKLAEGLFEQRAQLRTARAEAEAGVVAKEARLAGTLGMKDRAIAEERSAAAALVAQQKLEAAGGSYAVARERAEAAAQAATANAKATAAEAALAEQELAAAREVMRVAVEVATNPVELAGALAVAKADVERAKAQLAAAHAEQQIAARELDLLVVRAPASGVVMKVLAAPGATAGPEGEPILSLYDPLRLRARIDVPLGSVGAVRDGQRVELRSEVLGNVIVHGRVQRTQRESDLLKNTLQVKVQVLDPPPLLRPETLCRARFLAEPTEDAANTPSAFRVPKPAVQGGQVFVLDPDTGTVRGIAVEVIQEEGDRVIVRGELSVTQRAIVVPVTQGERVREELR
jgi:RND family efflux transporter MFP subunit